MEINKLCDKILDNAQNRAKSIIQSAELSASEILEAAQDNVEKLQSREKRRIQKECDEIIKNRLTLAELDSRKALLLTRRKLVDDCFETALTRLLKDDKQYLSLMQTLIEKYSEDGDEVILSKHNKGRITPEFISACAKKRKITLTISKTAGDFSGGVILTNDICDKNLTLEGLFRILSQKLEGQVSQILFEDKD